MNLPIRTFFALYAEGIKMEARYYRETLDISITPKMKIEYYELLRSRYNQMIDSKKPELPPPPPGPRLDSGSEERKTVVMSLFSTMRRAQFGR